MAAENDLGSLVYYFFQEFLPVHKGASRNTIASYRETFKIFLPWIFTARKAKAVEVGSIKPAEILNFLKFLETDRKNSARTRNARLAALKSFFAMCVLKSSCERRILEAIAFIPMKRVHKPLIDFFDHEAVLKIFSKIDRSSLSGKRDFLVLSLLYDTGMRASELAALRLDGFDRGAETLELLGKGNKWRKIRLWPRTRELLSDYVDNWRANPKPLYKDYLIISHRREALTRFGVHKVSAKYLKMAGIELQVRSAKRSAAHSWRHTAAVNMLRTGSSLLEIKVRLGHESLDTTAKYLNLDLSIKRARVDAFVRFTEILYPDEARADGVAPRSSNDVMDFLKARS